MTDLSQRHLVRGVDHAAFPTFDPAGTVRFYRDVLGFPVVHSICAAGWGPEDHPDFIHFFFDIGGGDRIAFFYYFGLEKFSDGPKGDSYASFDESVPEFFVRSRHLALHVDSEAHMLEYRRRLDGSEWPVELQVQHETIESIYTHDPNGYMVEITRALRPVTPQEDLDAALTVDALVEVVAQPDATMDDLLVRKAELIIERADEWESEQERRLLAGSAAGDDPHAGPEGADVMSHRLFMLDVPENTTICDVAAQIPGVKVGKVGPYFVISSEEAISIDRRATGVRHAVWYSCVAGLEGWRIAQWDKDALRTEER